MHLITIPKTSVGYDNQLGIKCSVVSFRMSAHSRMSLSVQNDFKLILFILVDNCNSEQFYVLCMTLNCIRSLRRSLAPLRYW